MREEEIRDDLVAFMKKRPNVNQVQVCIGESDYHYLSREKPQKEVRAPGVVWAVRAEKIDGLWWWTY